MLPLVQIEIYHQKVVKFGRNFTNGEFKKLKKWAEESQKLRCAL